MIVAASRKWVFKTMLKPLIITFFIMSAFGSVFLFYDMVIGFIFVESIIVFSTILTMLTVVFSSPLSYNFEANKITLLKRRPRCIIAYKKDIRYVQTTAGKVRDIGNIRVISGGMTYELRGITNLQGVKNYIENNFK